MKTQIAGTGPGLAGQIVAPNELHLPIGLTLDEGRVDAVYRILTTGPAEVATRIRESIRWLLQSWRNTPSLLVAQRLVLVRTAFEVLLTAGTEKNVSKEKQARGLSRIFELLSKDDRRAVTPGTLLWQPTQRHRLQLTHVNPRLAPFSRLEQWFVELSIARNAIVHDGALDRDQFKEQRSVFCGPYWRVGTRVLREAITVLLDTHGYPGLWRDHAYRAMLAILRQAMASADAAA